MNFFIFFNLLFIWLVSKSNRAILSSKQKLNLLILLFAIPTALVLLILGLFFLASKSEELYGLEQSIFECGFRSYFYRRFSFTIQYFLLGILFLFLDLELVFVMPLFSELTLGVHSRNYGWLFIIILILSLVFEWKQGKIEWKIYGLM